MTEETPYSMMTSFPDAPLAQLDRALDYEWFLTGATDSVGGPYYLVLFREFGESRFWLCALIRGVLGCLLYKNHTVSNREILRGWWGNPWGFESPLRHHHNSQRESRLTPGSLFSFFRPVGPIWVPRNSCGGTRGRDRRRNSIRCAGHTPTERGGVRPACGGRYRRKASLLMRSPASLVAVQEGPVVWNILFSPVIFESDGRKRKGMGLG